MVEMQSACLKQESVARHLLEARDFSRVKLHDLLYKGLKALEGTPMQVELTGDGYADGEIVYDFEKCPKCGWDFENGDKDWEEPYCCHCGQKLHWFD